MEPKSLSLDLAGRKFSFETGRIVTQADGTVLCSLGETIILATASIGEEPREGAEFLPLIVDYEERYYAAGKIKGSRFIKREGRPSEKAVITSRLIDRPIRPLFPKDLTNDVQVVCTVLSVDLEVEPGTTAVNAASLALLLAGTPFQGPVGAVRVGLSVNEKGEEELILNPTHQQCETGKLDLVVAGTLEAIMMVEAAAKEVSEETVIQALEIAHQHIKKICQLQNDYVKALKIEKKEYKPVTIHAEATVALEGFLTEETLDSVKGSKKEFKETFKILKEKVYEQFKKEIEEGKFSKNLLKEVLSEILEKRMRHKIIEHGERIDGRKLDELRPISCAVGVLPRTHGSGIFQRGETQILSTCTLGSPGSAQLIDTMDEDFTKRYIHHYNFPPYAVGEIKPFRGPSRREIGHGDLAERALIPVLPSKEEFPYTIWVVSETMSCNGSSSMASVCGSTLALMDAGVKIKKPVAGVAMGLVADGKGNYKILSDIQGLEDFGGDMDFKVCGTVDGITALQMDIKMKGLSTQIMREALAQAKKNRLEIIKKIVETIPEPRKELSKRAPLITTIRIEQDQIRDVIGKGGETIQKITAECNVEIDIEQDGLVTITAPTQENGKKALDWIKKITFLPQVGDVFEGKVTRTMDFGAFVEIAPGKEGLVHISQLAHARVNRVEDVVTVGDMLKVKLTEIDAQGRYNLSHKAVLPPPPRGKTEGGQHSHKPPSEG